MGATDDRALDAAEENYDAAILDVNVGGQFVFRLPGNWQRRIRRTCFCLATTTLLFGQLIYVRADVWLSPSMHCNCIEYLGLLLASHREASVSRLGRERPRLALPAPRCRSSVCIGATCYGAGSTTSVACQSGYQHSTCLRRQRQHADRDDSETGNTLENADRKQKALGPRIEFCNNAARQFFAHGRVRANHFEGVWAAFLFSNAAGAAQGSGRRRHRLSSRAAAGVRHRASP